jgi:hypothetical protein
VRVRSTFVLFIATALATIAGALAPAASAAQVQANPCITTLTCTAEQINTMTMAERLAFLRSMSPGAASGYAPRWGNIEGVLEFFDERNIGKPGTWISYVEAGDMEAIERGIAIAEGRATDTYANRGAVLWASYLLLLNSGELTGRAEHDRAWSQAEQSSIDDGVLLAEKTHGLKPTPAELRFFKFTEAYRWVMRNRTVAADLYLSSPSIGAGKPALQQKFLDWFTDVTNDVPAHAGAAFAYDVVTPNASSGVADFVQLFKAYVTYYYTQH